MSYKCQDKRRDCAVMVEKGNCKVLTDTNFGGKPCPFYCSYEEKKRIFKENDWEFDLFEYFKKRREAK